MVDSNIQTLSEETDTRKFTGKKVLVAMSGGVDSSLSAKLLTEQGYDCSGCTLKLFQSESAGSNSSRTCCSLDDTEDARAVARKLGIPFYVFNFTDIFYDKVVKNFIRSYQNARTPNPCIECNRSVKFGKLYERAKILGFEYIATGHYARIEQAGGKFLLKKALDETKDQSYVLYFMTQKQLAHTLFPLGELKKTEVRHLAGESGLPNADKPDSQDICFALDGDYTKVIDSFLTEKPSLGNFVDKSGNILGKHRGIAHYTVGQRKGLGVSNPTPLYVLDICPKSGNILLGDNTDLFKRELIVGDVNWIAGISPQRIFRCKAKIRYRQPEQWATVTPLDCDRVRITFETPQRAITPGQAAVLYDGDILLGGGTIQKTQNDSY